MCTCPAGYRGKSCSEEESGKSSCSLQVVNATSLSPHTESSQSGSSGTSGAVLGGGVAGIAMLFLVVVLVIVLVFVVRRQQRVKVIISGSGYGGVF